MKTKRVGIGDNRRAANGSQMPVVKQMCATCPFREGSPYAYLRASLAIDALSKNSRICHSTGCNNAINHRTGKPPMLCRGARNAQLDYFFHIGFIEAPTDEAWDKRRKQLGV